MKDKGTVKVSFLDSYSRMLWLFYQDELSGPEIRELDALVRVHWSR